MTRLVRGLRQWLRRRFGGYGEDMSTPARDDHMKLEQAFTQCAGQWVAVNRATGHVVAARPSPYELAAYLKEQGIGGVDVLRAPDASEPEVVGIG